MNIGQIYETVLGWAGQNLGRKFATHFDGASLDQINELTDEAGIPRFGHTYMMVVLESVSSSSNCWCNLC
jgi:DNA-directed RNA polymerase subunit beta